MNNYGYFFFRHGVRETKKTCKDIPQNTFAGYYFRYICIYYARVGTNINISRSCVCVCVCVCVLAKYLIHTNIKH